MLLRIIPILKNFFKINGIMKQTIKFFLVSIIFWISSLAYGQDSISFENILLNKVYNIELINGMTYQGHFVTINPKFVIFQTKNNIETKIPIEVISKISLPSFMTCKIVMKNGKVLIGDIISQDSTAISFRNTSFQKIEIYKNKIKSIQKLDESNFRNNKYWFPNPHPTRYLVGPNAYNLKKGEYNFQNTYLVLNTIDIGLTNYFSIGGGIDLSSFGSFSYGGFSPAVLLIPKIGLKVTDKFHAGVGGLIVYHGADDEFLGIAYGIGTYGTMENNITVGLGWGFLTGEFLKKPIFTVSGMTRISRKAALISENWIIPFEGYHIFFSYGIRFFGEKLSVDLAFINNDDISASIIFGIPYIDFKVKF